MTDISRDRWLLVGLAVLAIALAAPMVGAYEDGAPVIDDARDGHGGPASDHHTGAGTMHDAASHHAVGGQHHGIRNETVDHGPAVDGWVGNMTHAHETSNRNVTHTHGTPTNGTVGNTTASGHEVWGCH